MAHDGKRPRAQGPGRGTPRSRTAARPTQRAAKSGGVAKEGVSGVPKKVKESLTEVTQPRRGGTGSQLTRRALAVGVVLVALLVSYSGSLRVYLQQRHDIVLANQRIASRTEKISQLEDEIVRWQDPAYVRIQARERLGWVVPGETGYKVLGADGKPLGGGAEISTDGGFPKGEHAQTWWERMWESVQTADNPVPISKR